MTFGLKDLKDFAPPNSYINALDFSSPKDLADFLKQVARNENLYNRYVNI